MGAAAAFVDGDTEDSQPLGPAVLQGSDERRWCQERLTLSRFRLNNSSARPLFSLGRTASAMFEQGGDDEGLEAIGGNPKPMVALSCGALHWKSGPKGVASTRHGARC